MDVVPGGGIGGSGSIRSDDEILKAVVLLYKTEVRRPGACRNLCMSSHRQPDKQTYVCTHV